MLPDSRGLHERVTSEPENALATLTEEYGRPLFDYCLAVLGNVDMAIDAASGAILTAVSRTHELFDPAMFGPWLFSHARDECLLLTQMAPQGPRNQGSPKDRVEAAESSTGNPTASAAQADVALVREAVASLNGSDREVLALRRGFEFDRSQIAWIMGVSRANVAVRLSRADDHLHEAVDAQVLLNDPSGSCSALDELLAGSEDASALGKRRLVSAHFSDCPGCVARAADVRAVYALAAAGPLAFRSDFDARPAIEKRLAQGAPRRRRSAVRSVAAGATAPAHHGVRGSQATSRRTHQRRWWIPASAAALLVGGGVALAAATGPAEVPSASALPALIGPPSAGPDGFLRDGTQPSPSASRSPTPAVAADSDARLLGRLGGANAEPIVGAGSATGAAITGQSDRTESPVTVERLPSGPIAQPSRTAVAGLRPQPPRVTQAPQVPPPPPPTGPPVAPQPTVPAPPPPPPVDPPPPPPPVDPPPPPPPVDPPPPPPPVDPPPPPPPVDLTPSDPPIDPPPSDPPPQPDPDPSIEPEPTVEPSSSPLE